MIILIHGAGSNRLCWPPAIRRLRDHPIIALDLPGHGNSRDEIGYHSIESYAVRVAELQKSQGIYQAVLVGHSMGGAIALSVALQFPDLVSGLGMISTGAHFDIPEDLLELVRNPLTQPEALITLRQRSFSPKTSQNIVDQAMQPLEKVRQSVFQGDWNACAQFDLREELGALQIPVWIAVGADDSLTTPAQSRFFQKLISSASLQVIENAGHMVILEKPEELAVGLQQFLGSLHPEER